MESKTKLSLKKITISKLNNSKMVSIKGGTGTIGVEDDDDVDKSKLGDPFCRPKTRPTTHNDDIGIG